MAVFYSKPILQFGDGGRDILINCICLGLPNFILSIGLLAIVFTYNIDTGDDEILFPLARATTDDPAYYRVNINSTLLILVATWMSTLSPLSSTFAMALAKYPISQRLLQDTEARTLQSLPSPYQLSLALKIADGSPWSGLWGSLTYTEFWKKRVRRLAVVLTSLSVVAIPFMSLSAVVLAADAWLHISTKAKNVQKVGPLSDVIPSYGLALRAACTSTNNTYTALHAAQEICALNCSSRPPVLTDGYASLQVLGNQSGSLSVLETWQGTAQPYHYLAAAPTTINQNYEATAETFAVHTSCKSISRECNLQIGENTTFSCKNDTFYIDDGTLVSSSLYDNPFRYPDFDNDGDQNTHNGVENRFYFAAGFATNIMGPLPASMLSDPDAVMTGKTLAIVMTCDMTILDVIYDQIEGQIRRFDTRPSNVSTTYTVASAVVTTSCGRNNMISTMNLESLIAVSAQDLADRFATSLSTTILAGAVGAVRQVPVLAAQERRSILVTLLPKVPFFLLIATGLCYCVSAMALGIQAGMTTYDAGQVRCRLSIDGIVASKFDRLQSGSPTESSKELFREFKSQDVVDRIGVCRTEEGGCRFQAYRQKEPRSSEESDWQVVQESAGDIVLALRGEVRPGFIC